MNEKMAKQIAELLNRRNQLSSRYTVKKILSDAENYIYEYTDDVLIACVEVKKVQWYQWEILHLSVNKNYEGRQYGRRLVAKAEEKAIRDGAKVLQCTIKTDNKGSERVFSVCGYKQVALFYNSDTGNNVGVWQKVVGVRV